VIGDSVGRLAEQATPKSGPIAVPDNDEIAGALLCEFNDTLGWSAALGLTLDCQDAFRSEISRLQLSSLEKFFRGSELFFGLTR